MTFFRIIAGTVLVLGIVMFVAGVGVGAALGLDLLPRGECSFDVVKMLIGLSFPTSIIGLVASIAAFDV